jgi:hypothetical protein
MKIGTATSCVGLALCTFQAQALEPLKTYDKFSGSSINGALWPDAERSVQVKNGQLQFLQRHYAVTTTNSGSYHDSLLFDIANPVPVNELSVQVTINGVEAPACAANPTVSESRARLDAAFFNVSVPTPGSSQGDVIGEIRVARFSNTTDPEGMLRVAGYIEYCLDPSCSNANFSSSVDLSTVTIGHTAVIEIQWDQPNKQMIFSRDNGAFKGSVPYTVDDSHMPGFDFKGLVTRLDVSNCIGASPPAALIDASFDNFMVNKSAIP